MLIIGWFVAPARHACAQQALHASADVVFYADNTEFRNPFREGETIFGAAVRGEGRIELSSRVSISAGVFGNQRFGSASAFQLVRPVLTLTVLGKRSRFHFGTLDTPRAGRPSGPDRTGPHGLLPPLQQETLAFDRPYEAGLQWLFNGRRLEHDMWLHWQRLNTPAHRERLDAGASLDWRWRGIVSLPLQAHIVHEGGQLFASGVVRDSFALASGVRLSPRRKLTKRSGDDRRPATRVGSLEMLALWSHDTPDRQRPERTKDGAAFFGRAAIERSGWRAHLIMWRGDDFMKDEGDPNYRSRRRDGTRWRGVRDYAELGLTRTFALAPTAFIETSFRYHRVERFYEYSYRVLGVARAAARVK